MRVSCAGKALVISENWGNISPEELLAYREGCLAPYKWPRAVMFCEEFSRIALGKVIKMMLVNEPLLRFMVWSLLQKK